MKTTGLLVLVLSSQVLLGGVLHKGPKVSPPRDASGDESRILSRYMGPYPSTYSLGPGDSICFTTYDYGSNGSPLRNLINYGDGHLAIVRMAAQDTLGGWPTRGGYHFCSSDGGQRWSECRGRIEYERTGWDNVDQVRDAGGTEVVVSHVPGISVMITIDADRCMGVWSTSIGSSGAYLYPRIAVGSESVVHVVYTHNHPPTELLYMRSEDGGIIWSIDIPICTTPSFSQESGDHFDITARGSDVAVVCAGSGGDVVLARSTDLGLSWTETIIYDIDEALQTPNELVPDGSCGVIFDRDNNPHVVWGTFLSPGDGILQYSLDAGIMYWSEGTGIDTIAFSIQDTTICIPPGREGNYVSGPDIGVDSLSGVYVIYSQVIPERDTAGNCYEHVYAVASNDNGLTWSDAADITPGSGFDAAFPSLADLVDENLHIVYNCDPFAGNSVQLNHGLLQTAIMYLQVPASIFTGVQEVNGVLPSSFELGQNYPNPFNSRTRIGVRISDYEPVRLMVFDVLGREIATLMNETKWPGKYEVEWDATGFSSEVYIVRMIAGPFVATRKLILLR